MHRYASRPALLLLLAIWVSVVAYAAKMFVASEIGNRERQFEESVATIAGGVRQKLDTNEILLAGLAAFLKAVDADDTDSAMIYAASAAAAYPHIYMIEVARKVPVGEAAAFEAAMRAGWRADFRLKDFADITLRPSPDAGRKAATWPILFMYPALPEAEVIYGLRLETVDYLAQSLMLAHGGERPVASPVFRLFEGGSAYVLLREVNRPAHSPSATHFFGNTLAAILVIKAQSLFPVAGAPQLPPALRFGAVFAAQAKPQSVLYETPAAAESAVDAAWLPKFSRQVRLDNPSQPVLMDFEQQLRWSDILTRELVTILALLGGALLLAPWLVVRHLGALNREQVEHERSAYLATHDMLTDLPNRFLFADRFDQAVVNWRRNGPVFALLVVDLDHFKGINDLYGHDVGDQVLVEAARRMKRELRAGDTVARHGGDEFILLALNQLNADDARGVGEKLRAAIGEPVATSVGLLPISCSIGIALCPAHGQTLDVLRKAADQAMYVAKKHGRNKVSVCALAGGG